jgi:hypothetical protein
MLLVVPGLAWGQARVGGEFQINTYTTGVQALPHVASDADGNFAVVWLSSQQEGSLLDVYGRRYGATGTPIGGTEFRVNAYTSGIQRSVRVASGANGHLAAVWESPGQDGSGDGIFGRQIGTSGIPGAEFRVNSFTTGYQQRPSAAVAGDGSFVVVWQSYAPEDNSSWGIFAQRYASTGVAQGGEFRVNSYTTFSQESAAVAMAPGGGFVVVWQSYGIDGSGWGVFGQRYDAAGAALGGEFRVNADTPGFQGQPSVAMDSGGNFVVAWVSVGGGGYADIVARRFDAAGVPRGADFRVNSYTTASQTRASVASDAAGGFVVIWSSYHDGSGNGVFGRRFDEFGRADGSDFAVNTHTTGFQSYAAVASDASGNFVVVWESSGQDGEYGGVFGQRFEPDLIFRDDFEAGTLAAWSGGMADGGDLGVSTTAALNFTQAGLEGLVDDTVGIFVQDDSPDDERRYRARFYFDPNGFDPGETQGRFRTRLFIAFEEAPTRRLAAIVLRRQSGVYSLMGRCRLDDNAQANTPFVPVSDGPHAIELRWRRSSDPDAPDGECELFVDGSSVALLTGLDNSISAVDFVRMGALSVKVGATGTMFWDEFVSRRETLIGP